MRIQNINAKLFVAFSGYSIFVVLGELPECPADTIISQCPLDPALAAQEDPISDGQREDDDLAKAIALSLREVKNCFDAK